MEYKLDEYIIRNISMDGSTFLKGRQYSREQRIESLMSITGDSRHTVIAKASSSKGKQHSVKVFFHKTGDIIDFECSCPSHDTGGKACKHIIAVLFKLMQNTSLPAAYIEHKKQYILTDSLFDAFERNMYDEIDLEMSKLSHSSEKISLTPKLTDYRNECYLNFTIGAKRKYVVKNINELINNISGEKEFSYGKDLTFEHRPGNFDDDSKKLIEFIKNERDMFDSISKNLNFGYSYLYNLDHKRNLYLSKKGMDDFFDLYNGKTIDAELSVNRRGKIELTEELPPIQFRLEVGEDNYSLCGSLKNAPIYMGAKRNYMLLKDKLHAISLEYYNVLIPILSCFNKTEDNTIIFSKDTIHRFVTFILPKLKKFNLIEQDYELYAEVDYEPLIAKAYLDTENNAVICKIMFCYGEHEFNGLLNSDDGRLRDWPGEYRIKQKLKSCGFTAHGENYILTAEDDIYELYHKGLDEIKELCEVYATDAFTKKTYLQEGRMTKLGVRLKGELLEVSFDTSGYSLTELSEIMESLKNKKRYHRLRDGSFISLEDDNDLEQAAKIVDSLNLSDRELKKGKLLLPKYNALYLDELINENDAITIESDKYYKKIISDFKTFKEEKFDVPQALQKTLRPYQKKGYLWLKTLSHLGFGGILADDMGLGKTIQIITLLLSEKASGNYSPALIVCPTSLIYNWQNELNRFGKELTSLLITGSPASRRELLKEHTDIDVYITTYDTLKRDIDEYDSTHFKYLVADEAQNIKNPLTQNAKALKMINSDVRFALTGTPIENSLFELWSLFDFIMPGYLYSSTKFRKIYEIPIIKETNKEKSIVLKKQISPFILRRIKRDVLKELPEKIETVLYAEMTEEQKKLYAAYLLEARGELNLLLNEFDSSRFKILSQLTRLRQICCHPSLFVENFKGESGKLMLTFETLISSIEAGHRVLLFSQFTSMLAIIMDKLTAEGIDYFYLDGSVKSLQRMEMVESFNSGEKDLFLISLKAGGTGLNLTGADIVIHYDPWWNPAVMDQATDRTHRLGQKKTVQVLNMVTKNSIEEKILELQSKKKNLIDNVITEGGSFLNKMTKEEILELFADN